MFVKFLPKFNWHTITECSNPRKRFISQIAILALMGTVVLSQPAGASSMDDAFWQRNWRAMEEIYVNSADAITSKDISLYANGLWLQRRYADGLSLFETANDSFPPNVAPYAGMLSVLGMERAGRKDEALGLARSLWTVAPKPMRHYLAFAAGRLSRDLELKDEALTWFRRMSDAAPDKKRRVEALNEIVALPGATLEEAADLLVDSPANARALLLCSAAVVGSNSKVDYAIGYHAYLRKQYGTAVQRLSLAHDDAKYGEAARYYHAYALFRQKKHSEAFKLWSGVAQNGNDYPQRSISRISTLAANGMKSEALKLFRKVADGRSDYPDLAADALVAIARFGDEEVADEAIEELTLRFPSSNQCATAWWNRGWEAWKNNSSRLAEQAWGRGYVPGIRNTELAARLLYWRARALDRLEERTAAEQVRQLLLKETPGEYYSFLVSPDGGLIRGDIPLFYHAKSELEEWGFVTYARIEASSAENQLDPATQFRVSRLALWDGDFSTSARAFAILQRSDPKAQSLIPFVAYAYPRAFDNWVSRAAGKTGLEPAIIWGIMRQESYYDADVTSVASAYGLMQLMPATAREEAKKMKLPEDTYKNPAGNVMLGANHMVGLLARFKDLPRALAAYNAGGTPVTRWSKAPILDMAEWIEDIPYHETRGYVKAVLRNIETYRVVYGGQ